MTMDCITLAGFALAIFVAGVAVGKLVEKIERFISKKDNEEHETAQKKPPLRSLEKTKQRLFRFIYRA